MPFFEREGVSIHYEVHGSGYPVLLFAPGGMRSSIAHWERAPFDPRKELASDFRLIVMDQRNAGQSRAPVRGTDGWHSYAGDHVALLEHLKIDTCHLIGGCIGGAFCLGLMRAAPQKVTATVLQQPIGLSSTNREVFFDLFDGWAAEMRDQHPEANDAVWREFREHMYGGDFVFSVPRDFVSRCSTPMLVLMGNDVYHPSDISRELVTLAPNAELVERWKEGEVIQQTVSRVKDFFNRFEPARARP